MTPRPKKVKSPISNEYLTEGKEYEVLDYRKARIVQGQFYFYDDKDELRYSVLKVSSHLNGLDWLVTETE